MLFLVNESILQALCIKLKSVNNLEQSSTECVCVFWCSVIVKLMYLSATTLTIICRSNANLLTLLKRGSTYITVRVRWNARKWSTFSKQCEGPDQTIVEGTATRITTGSSRCNCQFAKYVHFYCFECESLEKDSNIYSAGAFLLSFKVQSFYKHFLLYNHFFVLFPYFLYML